MAFDFKKWLAGAAAEHAVIAGLITGGNFIWNAIGSKGREKAGEILTNQIERKFSEEHRHEVMGLILTLSDTIVGLKHEEWVRENPNRGSNARAIIMKRLRKTLKTHGKENEVLMLLSKDWHKHENDPIDTTLLEPTMNVDSKEFVELKKFINAHRYKFHLILLAEMKEQEWRQYLEHLKHDPIAQWWKGVDQNLGSVGEQMIARLHATQTQQRLEAEERARLRQERREQIIDGVGEMFRRFRRNP
jgi:hypothetical protein